MVPVGTVAFLSGPSPTFESCPRVTPLHGEGPHVHGHAPASPVTAVHGESPTWATARLQNSQGAPEAHQQGTTEPLSNNGTPCSVSPGHWRVTYTRMLHSSQQPRGGSTSIRQTNGHEEAQFPASVPAWDVQTERQSSGLRSALEWAVLPIAVMFLSFLGNENAPEFRPFLVNVPQCH